MHQRLTQFQIYFDTKKQLFPGQKKEEAENWKQMRQKEALPLKRISDLNKGPSTNHVVPTRVGDLI